MAEETPFTPYQIQRVLGVTVDGKWGPETERAARKFLGDPKDNTNRPWTAKRLILGVQQKIMKDAGIDVKVDGLPGGETWTAFEKWRSLAVDPVMELHAAQNGETIAAPIEASLLDFDIFKKLWDWLRSGYDKEPAPVVVEKPKIGPRGQEKPIKPPVLQPTTWPRQKDVVAFYGVNGNVPLYRVECPWQLELAWDPNTKVNSIVIHAKCAQSLDRVLKAQIAHYSEAGLRKLGVHKYGGSYNNRRMRGSNAWSMHAYGCAIDFDPDNNQLKWDHSRARLAKPDAEAWWKIWEAEGWTSLGRERDFDWMHVQAARL